MGNTQPHIFIVHGHSEVDTFKVKDFIRSLNLTPIDLQDQDDLGLTIIEKFEKYATQCDAAIVLMTPDDLVSPSGTGSDVQASRQNVMIELGWFMRHVGRSRVVILYQSGTHVPSDIAGVLYLAYDKSPLEVTEKMRQRLKGLGLI